MTNEGFLIIEDINTFWSERFSIGIESIFLAIPLISSSDNFEIASLILYKILCLFVKSLSIALTYLFKNFSETSFC